MKQDRLRNSLLDRLLCYLDEEVFRFNNREDNDGERFLKVVGGAAGRRLTYKALTGNVGGE